MGSTFENIQSSFWIAIWFVFLTFPLMVIKVNTIDQIIEWRFQNMIWVGLSIFFLSFAWRKLMQIKEAGKKDRKFHLFLLQRVNIKQKYYSQIVFIVILLGVGFPYIVSAYQINIITTAMIYVVLGLGLNIVVGLAGLLDLGYVAFYAVGAYAYALLNYHFQINFWFALPICGLLSAIFGVLLGFPVLRLRGDYLAIVTLGFGEIIRLILENWNAFSFGPSGIANIPRPPLAGLESNIQTASIGMYYLMVFMVLFTIFMVNRLQNSRIGRAWLALREDEIACQAMGIDRTKTKLLAFALGATWAGLMGAFFAAKTTFINPACFTFLESAIILSIVVLGGMGSILGVILAAFILILLPEYLRAFSEYRMLIFGASMVLMMVFRPQGLISHVSKHYQIPGKKDET
ncbi:MAG: branched-chain amino acid ABC transporter permease [Candidatus Magnetomorum sp.]|nr:branched-chain amino acid ABC transporter permease [Candidatus Magnetomorum sp.]